MKERIENSVMELRDEMISFLSRLVKEPSIQGNEAEAQRIMAIGMADLGAEVDVFEPDLNIIKNLPGYSPVNWSYEGRSNVVGTLKGRGGGRSLILNGHIDVVSPEPVNQWAHDPWGAEIEGSRMYGRGTGDMKAGLVQMLWAVKALRRIGIDLCGDLILESVLEEEIGGNGTLACCERGYLADGALITEPYPTGLLTSMGVLWAYILIRGHSSHPSRAEEGVNAILEAYPIIKAIKDLEERLNSQKHPEYREQKNPIFCNIGTIRGGDWPSTLPAECEMGVRIGFFPGMKIEEIREELEKTLDAAVRRTGNKWMIEKPPVIRYVGFAAEGSVFNRNSDFAHTLENTYLNMTGEPLPYRTARGCCDIRFFNLYYGIPSTTFGALIGNSHGVDEWVDLDSLEKVTKITARFIAEWCGISR